MTPWMQGHVGDIAWMQQHMGNLAWISGHRKPVAVDASPPGLHLMDADPSCPVGMDAGPHGQHPVDADPPVAVVMDDEPHGRHRLHAQLLGSMDRVAVGHVGVRRIVWIGWRLHR